MKILTSFFYLNKKFLIEIAQFIKTLLKKTEL